MGIGGWGHEISECTRTDKRIHPGSCSVRRLESIITILL